MSLKYSNKKKIFQGVFLVFLFIIFTISISSSISFFSNKNTSNANPDISNILGESSPQIIDQTNEDLQDVEELEPLDLSSPDIPPKDFKTLNILLLGYGGAGHQGGYLSDVIQVAHFNFEKKQITLISIPRDMWVTLPDGTANKINAAYAKDTKTATYSLKMANVITNMEIDYFVAMNFVGFKRAIGYGLKGIKVDVPNTLDDPWYPIEGEQLNPCGMTPEEVAETTRQYSGFALESKFECRYEHLLFEKGVNHMEGGDALKYVRSRHSTSDFDRSERQRAVFEAMRDKIFDLKYLDNLPRFFKEVATHTTSNIDVKLSKYLVPTFKTSFDFEIKGVTLSPNNVLRNSKSKTGRYILIPKAGIDKWGEVYEYIESEL